MSDNFTPLEEIPIVEKHAGGRPTVMTDDTLEKLKHGFMMGFSDREACAYAEINPQTLYNYQTANPEYLEQKEIWKENPILKAKVTIYSKLNEQDTAKWYLERKLRKEFATRTDITTDDQKIEAPVIYKPEKNTE